MNEFNFDAEYSQRIPIYERARDDVVAFLRNVLADSERIYKSRAESIESRIKEKQKTLDKAKEHEIPENQIFERVHDIAGIRVVCNNVQDIYTLLHAIEKAVEGHPDFELRQDGKDDKVILGDEKGYHAYHLDVKVRCQYMFETHCVPCEIQIQTLAQHAWCTLSHVDVYKPKDISKQDAECATKPMRTLGDYLFGADIVSQIYIRERIAHEPPGEFCEPIVGTDIDMEFLKRWLITSMSYFLLQIHADNVRKCGVRSKQELKDIKANFKTSKFSKWIKSSEFSKWVKENHIRFYSSRPAHERLFDSEKLYFAIVAEKKCLQKAIDLLKEYLEVEKRMSQLKGTFWSVEEMRK